MTHVEALQWLNRIFTGRLRANRHQLYELGSASKTFCLVSRPARETRRGPMTCGEDSGGYCARLYDIISYYILCYHNISYYIITCICMHTCICTYVCIYNYMYKYKYVYVCMYVCMYVYIYIYIYVCVYMYIYIYIHIHVYIILDHGHVTPPLSRAARRRATPPLRRRDHRGNPHARESRTLAPVRPGMQAAALQCLKAPDRGRLSRPSNPRVYRCGAFPGKTRSPESLSRPRVREKVQQRQHPRRAPATTCPSTASRTRRSPAQVR